MNKQLNDSYRMNENDCVNNLIAELSLTNDATARIESTARDLITSIRESQYKKGGIDAFMHEYDLSSDEGIALMCLAESLLRIPDNKTIEHLIEDKLSQGAWDERLGKSESLFVNAATWGLMITGKLMSQTDESKRIQFALTHVLKRGGTKVVMQAMKILSRQFVMAATIEDAVKRARAQERQGYRYSYDMLGEAARTADDAEIFYQAYQQAISVITKSKSGAGISIKLSALSPRYEYTQWDRAIKDVYPKLHHLALMAKEANINLTVDAEESTRLDLSLAMCEKIITDKTFAGWDGFGLAVQAYQKRAPFVLDYLIDLARANHRRLMLRLVKGAYWDTEIKDSQVRGLNEYPVFTRKESTDISYAVCVKRLFAATDVIYPQFATHNAYSVATILELAGECKDYEFQCLHGMGATLYDKIVGEDNMQLPCRVYAPVGSHKELLPYLVRRLLENGANTSFVNRLVDARAPIESLTVCPVTKLQSEGTIRHAKIPLPELIYGVERTNSEGIDFSNKAALQEIENQLEPEFAQFATEQPLPISDDETIEQALRLAHEHQPAWNATPVVDRAKCLLTMADLLEQHRPAIFARIIKEAGRTLIDAESEVREAIDFCRYYAAQAQQLQSQATVLSGPTGEHNELQLHARGVIATISPWNFPCAIFLGQVTSALVTGNAVVAKAAAQTTLIADYLIKLLYQAGIPKTILHLINGSGRIVGEKLVADPRVCGILFTGSTETARHINKTLANKPGPLAFLVAETGGQNTMIVDSTALPEQVVADVLASAFGSAGQRCSALRVLFLQEDIADTTLKMLKGAMAELIIGDPSYLSTDVGPVIDSKAKQELLEHKTRMQKEATCLYECKLPDFCKSRNYVAPTAYEIKDISELPKEVFGPILHVIRYAAKDLDKVIESINNTGYGLTLGIHTRIQAKADHIQQKINVGNTYVNRNMIGAVVGVQPFGGEGLSGTGPKAGGPHYLPRLCKEKTYTIDTTAAGGNATLLAI